MLEPVRVLIVDDHEMVREGLGLLLDEAEGVLVVGQAGTVAQALVHAQALVPDVILLDMVLPDGDGIDVLHALRAAGSQARVVILTSFAEEGKIKAAIQAGVTGYLLKDVLRQELLAAIRAAAEGRVTLHPVVQAVLMRQVGTPVTSSPLESLTERERDVLVNLAQGRSNKEIAQHLGLTLGTVKGYVSIVLRKLDVADRTQATLLAIRYGLVSPH